jgi:hypothetical protein
MRNAYSPTSYRLPSPAIPANAGPQPSARTALITLQEELQVLTSHGLVGARRMKIMRVDQAVASPHAVTASHASRQESIPVSAHVVTASRGALPPPQPEPAELEGMVDGQRVHLRSKVFRLVISSGRRLKKWRVMLQDKSPDEQLWAVTPPCGFSSHPAVRRWAEEMLTQAGYDPQHMFLEWEIFWRRRGWN